MPFWRPIIKHQKLYTLRFVSRYEAVAQQQVSRVWTVSVHENRDVCWKNEHRPPFTSWKSHTPHSPKGISFFSGIFNIHFEWWTNTSYPQTFPVPCVVFFQTYGIMKSCHALEIFQSRKTIKQKKPWARNCRHSCVLSVLFSFVQH